jgi:hypothetical protein
MAMGCGARSQGCDWAAGVAVVRKRTVVQAMESLFGPCRRRMQGRPSTRRRVRAELATRRGSEEEIGEQSSPETGLAAKHWPHPARCFMPTPPIAASRRVPLWPVRRVHAFETKSVTPPRLWRPCRPKAPPISCPLGPASFHVRLPCWTTTSWNSCASGQSPSPDMTLSPSGTAWKGEGALGSGTTQIRLRSCFHDPAVSSCCCFCFLSGSLLHTVHGGYTALVSSSPKYALGLWIQVGDASMPRACIHYHVPTLGHGHTSPSYRPGGPAQWSRPSNFTRPNATVILLFGGTSNTRLASARRRAAEGCARPPLGVRNVPIDASPTPMSARFSCAIPRRTREQSSRNRLLQHRACSLITG